MHKFADCQLQAVLYLFCTCRPMCCEVKHQRVICFSTAFTLCPGAGVCTTVIVFEEQQQHTRTHSEAGQGRAGQGRAGLAHQVRGGQGRGRQEGRGRKQGGTCTCSRYPHSWLPGFCFLPAPYSWISVCTAPSFYASSVPSCAGSGCLGYCCSTAESLLFFPAHHTVNHH